MSDTDESHTQSMGDTPGPLEQWVATRLGDEAEQIACQWLDELRARLEERPRRIFPDRTLLNHMPQLIQRVAQSLASGKSLIDEEFVREEIEALAQLRRNQGYSVMEILDEFDLLASILFARLHTFARQFQPGARPSESIRIAERLDQAMRRLFQLTVKAFGGSEEAERVHKHALIASFGSSVGHELRNRLNGLLMRLERAKNGHAGELDEAIKSLHHVSSVASDMVAMTVTEAEDADSIGSRVPVNQLVDEIIAQLRPFASARGVAVTAEQLPSFLVDKARGQLVLVNLISNAIKYSDASKEPRWVKVSAKRTDNEREWQIDVEDNGLGIVPQLTETIFEPRFRGASTEKGSGLGLALARRAASQLGGSITVCSAPDQGSTFSVTLHEPQREI